MRARLMPGLAAAFGLLVAFGCAPVDHPPTTERPSGEPRQDFARAVELQRQGEHVMSVAFFRAAAEAESQEPGIHVELAKALHNASIQMGFSGHGVRYAVARSQDRARLRNDALVEIDRALELARDPSDQAAMWLVRARVLELSGYVADASASADRALALVPRDATVQAWRARLDARLRAGH